MSKGQFPFNHSRLFELISLFCLRTQLQRRALDGGAPFLDLRGRRLLLRRRLRRLSVRSTEAARPQDVQAHPEAGARLNRKKLARVSASKMA